jgi:GNAT superfamily N-acetyltransferase
MISREINAVELGKLLSLYGHLHASDDPLPEQSAIEALWLDIQNNAMLKYFGGFINDALVSACTLAIIPNLTRGCRPYGVIENVVTHSGYRRKGYGRTVLEYTLAYAWRNNCYKVMLMTGRKSEGVNRFYESAGFDRYAKQAFLAKPQPFNQNSSVDVSYIARPLNPPAGD